MMQVNIKALERKNLELEKKNQELEILIKNIKTAEAWLKAQLEKRIKKLEAEKKEAEREKVLLGTQVRIEAEHKIAVEVEKVSLRLKELEHIINNSPAIVFLWRASHGWPVEFVSDNIRQFGYRPEDFYFKKLHLSSIVHPDDLDHMIEEVNRYNKEHRDSFYQEYRIITKSGKIRWLNDHTWVRRNKEGVITHYEGILLDITENKRQLTELLQTERMAAIGTMAASVAHELRNPLSVIQFALENIDRRVAENNAEIKRPISNIRNKLQESEKIIKDLLSYSRLGSPVLEETDINLLLKEAISSVAVAFQDQNIEIIKQLNKIPKINIDKVQIRGVFQNIIRNAYEAIGEKQGTITISTRFIKNKSQIFITIADSGCGISKEKIKNLAKPFFSTKARGTGLGLALAFRIVRENHNGEIDVKSKVGAGTTFLIKLPV